jgi:hypothetical protein
MVVVPYVRGMLRPEVAAAVCREWPEAVLWEHEDGHGWTLPNLLRRWWREPGELVIVEQDAVPPPGAIASILACGREWCFHPAWIQNRYADRTHNLVRYSERLRRRLPQAADYALAPNPFWRQRTCLRAGEENPWPEDRPESWPTSIRRQTADTALALQLLRLGVEPHRHLPPVRHLHDYTREGGEPDPTAW